MSDKFFTGIPMELWFLSVILVLAVVVLSLYAMGLNRKIQQLSERQQLQLDRLQRDLHSMNSAAIGVGQRLFSAEKKLKAAMQAQPQPTSQSTAFDGDSLDRASHYADPGISARELVERYGLSEAEANLMSLLKMHGVDQEVAS